MNPITEVADTAKAELRAVKTDATATLKRIEQAIEHWYAEHFRRAAQAGVAPITATEKAAIHAAVSAALIPPKE